MTNARVAGVGQNMKRAADDEAILDTVGSAPKVRKRRRRVVLVWPRDILGLILELVPRVATFEAFSQSCRALRQRAIQLGAAHLSRFIRIPRAPDALEGLPFRRALSVARGKCEICGAGRVRRGRASPWNVFAHQHCIEHTATKSQSNILSTYGVDMSRWVPATGHRVFQWRTGYNPNSAHARWQAPFYWVRSGFDNHMDEATVETAVRSLFGQSLQERRAHVVRLAEEKRQREAAEAEAHAQRQRARTAQRRQQRTHQIQQWMDQRHVPLERQPDVLRRVASYLTGGGSWTKTEKTLNAMLASGSTLICAFLACTNTSAVACPHHRCRMCCPGCPRHRK